MEVTDAGKTAGRTRETREGKERAPLPSRVSLVRHVLSCAHYFQAPVKQDIDSVSVHFEYAKKNLATTQPSLLDAWSMTLISLSWPDSFLGRDGKCRNQQREKQNEKPSEVDREKTKMQEKKTRKSCNTAFFADQTVYL